MKFEDQVKYFNLCNPEEPLATDDQRLVEIDRYGEDDTLARGYVWVEEMARKIELSQRPVRELYSGLPGSGKSTVLNRLKVRFEGAPGGRFLCVPIDAFQRFDLKAPIEVPDVLVMVAYEIERAVLAAEGRDPDLALSEGYLTRFWHWLRETDVSVEKFEVGVGGELKAGENKLTAGPKAVLGFQTNPSLRAKMRAAVEQRMSTFLTEVYEEIGRFYARAVACGRRGIVVIVDSLEKLSGVSNNFDDVLASAERLFADGASNLRLTPDGAPSPPLVHAVYTVPPALAFRRAITGLRFMPMIKLHDRVTGEPFEPGYRAAREIIAKRVPDEILAEIFGEASVEPRVHELISWSGGYPREIVRLLQIMVQQTGVVSERVFKKLLGTAGDEYTRLVADDAVPWLARVALDRTLAVESDGHRSIVDNLISNSVVLRYQNDREWFDLHPAVAAMASVERARKDLEASRAAARRDAAIRAGR